MSRPENYSEIEAENFSNIKRILDSPAAYKLGKEDKPDSTAFAVGNLAHAMVLEGKDLRDMYACKPDGMSFATKEGKEWKAAQTAEILTFEEYNLIPKMAEAVANNEEASALIRQYDQREILIEGVIQGIPFKGILDAFGMDANKRHGHIDLKTVQSAKAHKAKQIVYDFHYDLQDEIYSYLIAQKYGAGERPPSAWIMIEKTVPYEVCCYYPTDAMIEVGQTKLQVCIDRLKACRAKNVWPKSLGGLNPLEPSAWALENARKLAEFTI